MYIYIYIYTYIYMYWTHTYTHGTYIYIYIYIRLRVVECQSCPSMRNHTACHTQIEKNAKSYEDEVSTKHEHRLRVCLAVNEITSICYRPPHRWCPLLLPPRGQPKNNAIFLYKTLYTCLFVSPRNYLHSCKRHTCMQRHMI